MILVSAINTAHHWGAFSWQLTTLKFRITSWLIFPVFAVRATTMGSASTSWLVALTVFLEALALHTVAGKRLFFHQWINLAGLTVFAALTRAFLTTGLACPVTLAVLCVTVWFDTPAPDVALGLHAVEQIVDSPFFWVGVDLLTRIELMCWSAYLELPL